LKDDVPAVGSLAGAWEAHWTRVSDAYGGSEKMRAREHMLLLEARRLGVTGLSGYNEDRWGRDVCLTQAALETIHRDVVSKAFNEARSWTGYYPPDEVLQEYPSLWGQVQAQRAAVLHAETRRRRQADMADMCAALDKAARTLEWKSVSFETRRTSGAVMTVKGQAACGLGVAKIDGRWSVNHVDTGLAVVRGLVTAVEGRRTVAMLRGVDWGRSAEELAGDAAVRERVVLAYGLARGVWCEEFGSQPASQPASQV